MKSKFYLLSAAIIVGAILWLMPQEHLNEHEEKIRTKKARSEYFFNKLKDPVAGTIPENARNRELAFAKRLKQSTAGLRTQEDNPHTWQELGPSDVGGRTRTIGIDARNSNVVMAAGVSGGIWRSANGGTTWDLVSPNGSNLSISSITQDKINQNIWYASTGEVSNNTASGKGDSGVNYAGAGLYISGDNGQSWNLLTYSENSEGNYALDQIADISIKNTQADPFAFSTKIIAHDFGDGIGAVFLASQNRGLWVSGDNGQTWEPFARESLGQEVGADLLIEPQYCDIVIDENNIITIFLGPVIEDSPYGFFRSYDLGETFFNVTPQDYVATFEARTLLALAPSSQKTMYAFNHLGGNDHSLLFYNFTDFDNDTGDVQLLDVSANLPDYPRSIFDGAETFGTQDGYDMALAVHPTIPSLVVLGAVNLMRSETGFTTSLVDDPASTWIGGNDNPDLQDEGIFFSEDFKHHADQHFLLFDPNNPNRLWSSHDGGLSKTEDITADRVAWTSMNNDYNVTQYYHVSLAPDEDFLLGGTQDNGTPGLAFEGFDGTLVPSVGDFSSGDGAFSFVGSNIGYASSQEGFVGAETAEGFVNVRREDLQRLFIHPFAVDPNDDGTIFYPDVFGGIIARNTQVDEALAAADQSIVDNGWEDLQLTASMTITALKVTTNAPSQRLYVGGYADTGEGLLLRLDNAATASVDNFEAAVVPVENSSWLNDIAINPMDGNEIMLVYSNYNIAGLFHSADGGASFTNVEGNLGTGDDRLDFGETGPSLRAAEIIQYPDGTRKYVVASSIGVYSTSELNGTSTVWMLEIDQLNNVVVEDLDQRAADRTLVAATHGRGVFLGSAEQVEEVLPDLSWESFSVTNSAGASTFGSDENAFFNLSISNLGSAATAESFYVLYDADGELDSTLVDDVIAAGETKTYNFDVGMIEDAGQYMITATIDPQNEITESDETNNLVSTSFEVIEPQELPNLVISAFSLVNENNADVLNFLEFIFIEMTITNTGTAPISEGTSIICGFFVNNSNFSVEFEGPILAGESVNFSRNVENLPAANITEPGTYSIQATIDSPNFIEESNETDNEFETIIEVVFNEETVETGITDPATSALLSIYPNPVKGSQFTAEIPQGNQLNELKLFSISGREMSILSRPEGNQHVISTRNLTAGLYVLFFDIDGNKGSKKIRISR